MRTFLDDLRYGLRQLLHRPSFLIAAVLSLALGIAANTVLFGVLNRLLISDLPGVSDSARQVDLGRGSRNERFDTFAAPDIDDVRTQVPALDRVYGYAIAPLNLRRSAEATRVLGFVVSEDYFEALGVASGGGRLFGRGDRDALLAQPGVVLSDAAWKRLYAGDARVLGATVSLNGQSFQVLGVTAPAFRGNLAGIVPDVYVPLASAGLVNSQWRDLVTARNARWLLAGGRLAPGATPEQAQLQLDALAGRLAAAYPDSHREMSLGIAPLKPLPAAARGAVQMFATVMFVLVGLLLVLACVNVAGMMLARGEARGGELALRAALGASRARVVRQLFAEGLVLAALSGVAGLVLAAWARDLLRLIPIPAPYPLDLSVPFDPAVYGFTLAISVAAALVFALLPALRLSLRDPRAQLSPGGATDTRQRTRTRDALVVVQIAVTLVLLVAAGLFLRSLGRAAEVDPGFRVAGVNYADLDLQPAGYDDAHVATLVRGLLERVRTLPGVESASVGGVLPLTLSRMGLGAARLSDRPDQLLDPEVNPVASGYFRTLGIPLARGRDFNERDVAGGEDVAVINATFARQLFGDLDPIGRSFQLGFGEDWRTLRVVGLTPDGKYGSLSERPVPFLYVALSQWPRQSLNLMVRTAMPPAALGALLRKELTALDPNLPALDVRALSEAAQVSVLPQRIAGVVATALGCVGLLLAGTGLYGLLALYVAQRRREIGVRLALGATRGSVVATVTRRALRLAGLGVAIGAVLALAAAQGLSDLLFGIGASDVVALAGAAVALAVAVAIAALGPALRAAAVQPSQALRNE